MTADTSLITVEGLGKRYHLGAEKQQYRTLRDLVAQTASRPLRRLANPGSSSGNVKEMWALRNVSVSVAKGEVVGVIGRNGAGKSTLLKILSGITEPTEGIARMRGRVASLLEVGTGFHPELTGRENIYLNGAILGMTRAEIRSQFEGIVLFSEIGEFLDTPVKRYSSGMYVRLAFAVAAHLQPEILLVDEVLAVGDYQFQKKCLGKMGSVAKEGRTVLFVSHNMGAVSSLCTRAILLDRGGVVADGPTADVVQEYVATSSQSGAEAVWASEAEAPGGQVVRIAAVRVRAGGRCTSDVDITEDVTVEVEYWVVQEAPRLFASLILHDQLGVLAFVTSNLPSVSIAHDGWGGERHSPAMYRTRCTVPGGLLNDGIYRATVTVNSDFSRREASVEEAVSFTVHDSGGMRKEYAGGWPGVIRPKLDWQTELLSDAYLSRKEFEA